MTLFLSRGEGRVIVQLIRRALGECQQDGFPSPYDTAVMIALRKRLERWIASPKEQV